MRLFLSGLIFLALAGCGTQIYDDAKAGELTGSLIVLWVGDGEDDSLGDGRFVFLTPKADPLVFRRPGEDAISIRPGMIYTDGGSVPKIAQPLKGFSPWGYAPAYMIHDWLFVARKCFNDGKATEYEAQIVGDMEFRDTATILAEVIRTLIRDKRVLENDVAPGAITWAVSSPTTQALWRDTGSCDSNRISKAHRDQIEAALPGATGLKTLRVPQPTDVTPARVLAILTF